MVSDNSGNSRITWRIRNSVLKRSVNCMTMPDFEALGVSLGILVLTLNSYVYTVGCRLVARSVNEEYIKYLPCNPSTFEFFDMTASKIVTVLSGMPFKCSVGCDNILSLAP